ncbi:MAG: hypothetical protein MRY83_23480, partial [Flavobacteriales bacterium]|nr:hypothetical protein [Flavobacteriales bacterium]
MKFKSITTLILIFTVFSSIGQSIWSGGDSLKAPTAPNTSSLFKHNDIAVSNHTGTPSIALPIGSLSSGKTSTNVSIVYHSSGVKVSEIASSVGLGWSLKAGGSITRSVRNMPDEGGRTPNVSNCPGFYETYGLNNLGTASDGTTIDSSNYYDYNGVSIWTAGSKGWLDTESDIYSFSFNGKTGSFYFDHNRNPVLKEHSNLKIEVYYDPNVNVLVNQHSRFLYFTITDGKGIKYYFGGSDQKANTSAIDRVYASSYQTNESRIPQVQTWHLVKIEDLNGNRIEFEYEAELFTSRSLGTWSSDIDINTVFSGSSSSPFRHGKGQNSILTHTQQARLTEIRSSSSTISFDYSKVREDIGNSSNFVFMTPVNSDGQSKALTNIYIKNKTGVCIKSYKLIQDYFSCNSLSYAYLPPLNSAASTANPDKKRLRLLEVKEQSCKGNLDDLVHKFEYLDIDFGDGNRLPGRFSMAQDHWGYYNGITNNITMLPQRPHKYIPSDQQGFQAKRTVNNIASALSCNTNFSCECQNSNNSKISINGAAVLTNPNS